MKAKANYLKYYDLFEIKIIIFRLRVTKLTLTMSSARKSHHSLSASKSIKLQWKDET